MGFYGRYCFVIKRTLIYYVATVHAEDLTFNVLIQHKSTLLGLVYFVKNNALPEQSTLRLNYSKM